MIASLPEQHNVGIVSQPGIPENCGLGMMVTNEVEEICQMSQSNT
jgi:hypothetical protein